MTIQKPATELKVQQENATQRVKSGTASFQKILEERASEDSKNSYFKLAGADNTITYHGVTFVCDREHDTLCLGDCSRPRECVRVSLSCGGSLLVNPDHLSELPKAMGMFSAEDQNRIMAAIQLYKKVQQTQEEIEDEKSRIE